MYLFGNDEYFIFIECEKCGRVLKFDKKYFTSISENECVCKLPLQCSCGNLSQTSITTKPINVKTPSRQHSSSNLVKCPKCGSTQISANKKGFGLGKAVAGTALTGALIGAGAGFIGSNKVICTCLKCGHSWKAGKQ